jgi:predicted ATPase
MRLLLARIEGNPLFLEESVRSLVDDGVLAGERGGYRLVKARETIHVPATVQAILTARIDRLAAADKDPLQTASVVGTDVPVAVLAGIAGASADALAEGLGRLQVAEFLYETRMLPDAAIQVQELAEARPGFPAPPRAASAPRLGNEVRRLQGKLHERIRERRDRAAPGAGSGGH